jgi:Zn-dependent peptidase ImmA (M78 family)
MPERIHMGPLTYTISTSREEWELLAQGADDNAFGFIETAKGTIHIRDDVSPSLQRQTLLHELLHAAVFVGNEGDDKRDLGRCHVWSVA